ncbi:L,D-transpeptidase family protein [Roseitranquillus sediminis]|uniref:L,D-transpeptidase family protein n=1 Tax=Roseitranquillus sediminis TaxID=2809051 RepID=UPI001D0C882E|nr:L,D-transpeptidase family protein [Roseitranquillus sediminis]MBM9593820.1 L,D-transpeptidase family protein [Roseitranquillus sediminis]
MHFLRAMLVVAMALAVSGCASKFKTYDGPEVTQVQVFKNSRKMYLMHHDQVLRAFDIDLGFAPEGHKVARGDGRTPEGVYTIDRRNPESQFHLSVGIDYPRPVDVDVARAAGFDPGGDIFIHGESKSRIKRRDWTAGCIAVKNDEIEDVYAMVRDGTVVVINP